MLRSLASACRRTPAHCRLLAGNGSSCSPPALARPPPTSLPCAAPLHLHARRSMSASAAAGGDGPSSAAPFSGPGADDLAGMSCQALGGCSKETPLVPPSELPGRLASVPQWALSPDGKGISRKFTARNFVAAVKFVSDAAVVAEEENHHPDLHITSYREVEVVLSTHAVGGLTIHDFVVAAKLDKIEVDYSPKWLREQTGGA